VDRKIFQLWGEVVSIASAIEFSEKDDELVWQLNLVVVYSSQSLYSVINFRGGATCVHSCCLEIVDPSRIHFFLWLLSNNRLLTRDNLEKRQKLDNNRCMFCDEKESVEHLFFSCVVARQVWVVVSEIVGFFDWYKL
jgi:hypothetical protein